MGWWIDSVGLQSLKEGQNYGICVHDIWYVNEKVMQDYTRRIGGPSQLGVALAAGDGGRRML